MRTVYVAYPYGRREGVSYTIRRVRVGEAIEVGRELILKGFCPVIPLLYHFVHQGWKYTPNEDTWLNLCLELLKRCDCILVSGDSIGVRAEEYEAKKFGIPVYYDIEEVR